MITLDKISNINNLFMSSECNHILNDIVNKTNFRLCLNVNPIENARAFFANVILLGVLFDISRSDLVKIYNDTNSFVENKVVEKFKCKNITKTIKQKFFNYATSTFCDVCFHGTNSRWDENFYGSANELNYKSDVLVNINNIYEKYGYYRALEGKLLDKKNNRNFYTTLSINAAIFYALQSPEYLNRFVARSDYYKLDPYKYDRLALYRRDRYTCLNNVKKEIQEFGFSVKDKQLVVKNTKKLYDYAIKKNIVCKVFVAKSNTANQKYYNINIENYGLLELLHLASPEVHSPTNFEDFRQNIIGEINLPLVDKVLKKKPVIRNKKFIYINGKKYYPDFYSLGKFSYGPFYFLDKPLKEWNCQTLNSESIDKEIKYQLISDYFPNNKKARVLLNNWQKTISLNEVAQWYKSKIELMIDKLNNLELDDKIKLIKSISEKEGLRYISIKHYGKFYKNVNHAFLFDYSKTLGRALYKKFAAREEITDQMINEQVKFYNLVLNNVDKVIEKNLPVKLVKGEIKL